MSYQYVPVPVTAPVLKHLKQEYLYLETLDISVGYIVKKQFLYLTFEYDVLKLSENLLIGLK